MSYTKGQQRLMDDIHKKIMDGYKRGVCDKDGHSVNRADGTPVAKPRGGYVTFRKVYPRYNEG